MYCFILTSTYVVLLAQGKKNRAIDLWASSNKMAFKNLIPCTASISLGFLLILNMDLRFFLSEKAIIHSSEKMTVKI